jgi:hypothetical protein
MCKGGNIWRSLTGDHQVLVPVRKKWQVLNYLKPMKHMDRTTILRLEVCWDEVKSSTITMCVLPDDIMPMYLCEIHICEDSSLWLSCSYNPGKKLVDFLNFQTLSPSPFIQCWYLGDMCCKSTLPEPTLSLGGGWGGSKVNICFNWKMLTFSSCVFKFGCIFRKVYRYFFQDCLKKYNG